MHAVKWMTMEQQNLDLLNNPYLTRVNTLYLPYSTLLHIPHIPLSVHCRASGSLRITACILIYGKCPKILNTLFHTI